MSRFIIRKLAPITLLCCLPMAVGSGAAAKESRTIQISGKVQSLAGEPMEGVAVWLVLPSPNAKLCSIKTVAVKGNSESANAVRMALQEGRTWMKLAGSTKTADAVLDVAEARSREYNLTFIAYVTVTITLTHRETGEFLWSGSNKAAERDPWWGPGTRVSARKLFKGLSKTANCVGLEKEIGRTDAEGAFEGEVELEEIGEKRFTLKAGASGYAEAREPVRVLLPATSISLNLFLRKLDDASEQPRLEALKKLVMNRLGKAASHRNVSSEARAEFNKAMRIWRKSRQPGEAEIHFTRAAELAPRFAEATVLAAVALMGTGGWTAAGRILPGAIDADPELAEAYLVKGVWENFRHLPGQAVETLGQMVKTRRRVSWLRNLELARAFLMKGDWEQAEAHLEESLKAGAPKADIFYLRARALAGRGDYHAALEDVFRLRKRIKESRMPTPMAEFAADLEERVSGIASYRIIPFLEASTEELRKGGAPYLEGLQPASSQAKLAELLECVGRKVGVFFEVCPNTTAIETLRQSQFGKSGKVRLSRLETFEYMMAVNSFEGQPSVEEYRSDGAGNLRHQGGLQDGFMVTKGFPASQVVLHPLHQPSMDYRYRGTVAEEGRKLEVVAFIEKPNKKYNLGSFRIESSRLVMLRLQGIAWIDGETCRVVRVRTELVEPHPEVRLGRRTNDVKYGEVRFREDNRRMWLPKRAVVAIDWSGKRLRNEHTFSDYKLFEVETEDTVIRMVKDEPTVPVPSNP